MDITTKKITVKGTQTKLIIVDAAGQEFFGKLRPNYYRGASGALIFCSLNKRKSIESVPAWLEEFKKYIPSSDIPISIVVVINQKERIIGTKKRRIHLKHPRRKRTILKILRTLHVFNKKNLRRKKVVKKKIKPIESPKDWLILSNSELVSHFALQYDLGVCKVNMKNARDISKCFSHIAEQVIRA